MIDRDALERAVLDIDPKTFVWETDDETVIYYGNDATRIGIHREINGTIMLRCTGVWLPEHRRVLRAVLDYLDGVTPDGEG